MLRRAEDQWSITAILATLMLLQSTFMGEEGLACAAKDNGSKHGTTISQNSKLRYQSNLTRVDSVKGTEEVITRKGWCLVEVTAM